MLVAGRVFAAGMSLHAPELIYLEVAQVLRRYERTRELAARRARQALADLADLSIETYPHLPLLGRAWELRGNLTSYDSAYVALAEALDAPLLTCDARLAAGRRGARIELVGRPA